MSRNPSRISFFIITTLIFLGGYGYFVALADAPSGGYDPGATLNPDCSPGETSPEPCIVKLPLTTADNGLTATGSNIQLGGTLTQDTNIDQDGFGYTVTSTVPDGLGGLLGVSQSLTLISGSPGAFLGYLTAGGDGSRSIFYTFGNTVESFFGAGGVNHTHGGAEAIAHYDTTDTTSALLTLQAYDDGVNESIISLRPTGINLSFGGISDLSINNDAGTAGQVLLSNGTGVAPSWETVAGATPAWYLGGNSGTTVGTDFIGTTDAEDFMIKTNSVQIALFGQNGNVAMGGYDQDADAQYSGAVVASGKGAIALGGSPDFSSGGNPLLASGIFAVALGAQNTASGDFSTALGWANVASGNNSTSFGSSNTASGVTSTAFGLGTTASGLQAISFGIYTLASGDYSTAFGGLSTASGQTSTAFGSETTASGIKSTAFGGETVASGVGSTAFGNSTYATGKYSTTMGQITQASSYGETALGIQNATYTPISATTLDTKDRLFVVGNGNGTGHNAYTMWKDGSFAYNDDNFQNDSGAEQNMFYFNYGNHDGLGSVQSKRAIRLGSAANDEWDISSANVGDRSIAIGFTASSLDPSFSGPIASGSFSFAVQSGNAAGILSAAFGNGKSTGILGMAWGGTSGGVPTSIPTASGDYSTAWGDGLNVASGNGSTAFGDETTASGLYATAFGSRMYARSLDEVAIGSFGTDYTPIEVNSFDAGDRLFSIGNGAFFGAESDAFTILKNGEVGIGIDNFQTNSNSNLFQVGDGTTNIIGYVDDATGNWVAVSDERKKDNIQDLSYGLPELLQLRPTSFDYKRNGEHSIGFIAQQVLPIIPESVYGSESEGYGMSYATLTPVIVKAIQDMNLNITEIADLTKTNTWRDALIGWFESATNGIRSLVVHDKICVDDQCLTKDDIHALLELKNTTTINTTNTGDSPTGPVSDPVPTPDQNPEPETPDNSVVTSDSSEPSADATIPDAPPVESTPDSNVSE